MAKDKWVEILGWGKTEIDDLRFVAHSYIKQGIYDIALTFFDAIQVLTTPTPYDLQTMGALYLQLGNAEKSLHYFERALAIDPTHALTQLNRVKALFMLGQEKEAFMLARELEHSEAI